MNTPAKAPSNPFRTVQRTPSIDTSRRGGGVGGGGGGSWGPSVDRPDGPGRGPGRGPWDPGRGGCTPSGGPSLSDKIIEGLEKAEKMLDLFGKIINHLLEWVPKVLDWAIPLIKNGWAKLCEWFGRMWKAIADLIAQLGNPWALSAAANNWNVVVGAPGAGMAEAVNAKQMNVDQYWRGQAADQYKSAIGAQSVAMLNLKLNFSDPVMQALKEMHTHLLTFYMAVVSTLAGAITGIIAGTGSACTIIGIPPGIGIAVTAIVATVSGVAVAVNTLQGGAETVASQLQMAYANTSGYPGRKWPVTAVSGGTGGTGGTTHDPKDGAKGDKGDKGDKGEKGKDGKDGKTVTIGGDTGGDGGSGTVPGNGGGAGTVPGAGGAGGRVPGVGGNTNTNTNEIHVNVGKDGSVDASVSSDSTSLEGSSHVDGGTVDAGTGGVPGGVINGPEDLGDPSANAEKYKMPPRLVLGPDGNYHPEGMPTGADSGAPGGSVPGAPGGSIAGAPGGPVPGAPGGSVPGAPAGTVPGVPGESVPGLPGGSVPGVGDGIPGVGDVVTPGGSVTAPGGMRLPEKLVLGTDGQYYEEGVYPGTPFNFDEYRRAQLGQADVPSHSFPEGGNAEIPDGGGASIPEMPDGVRPGTGEFVSASVSADGGAMPAAGGVGGGGMASGTVGAGGGVGGAGVAGAPQVDSMIGTRGEATAGGAAESHGGSSTSSRGGHSGGVMGGMPMGAMGGAGGGGSERRSGGSQLRAPKLEDLMDDSDSASHMEDIVPVDAEPAGEESLAERLARRLGGNS